jgi:hypothetical protein
MINLALGRHADVAKDLRILHAAEMTTRGARTSHGSALCGAAPGITIGGR